MMTIKEARKILGKASESLSDSEIEEMVNTLSIIAKEALKTASNEVIMNNVQPGSVRPGNSASIDERDV